MRMPFGLLDIDIRSMAQHALYELRKVREGRVNEVEATLQTAVSGGHLYISVGSRMSQGDAGAPFVILSFKRQGAKVRVERILPGVSFQEGGDSDRRMREDAVLHGLIALEEAACGNGD